MYRRVTERRNDSGEPAQTLCPGAAAERARGRSVRASQTGFADVPETIEANSRLYARPVLWIILVARYGASPCWWFTPRRAEGS